MSSFIDPALLDRRRWLSCASAGPLALACRQAWAADEQQPLNRFPRMVHEWFVDQVISAEKKKLARLEGLKTPTDARNYVAAIRGSVRKSFGVEPKRTPLRARVTGVLEREHYRIEKVVFESRPNFPVTANLYLPNPIRGKVPGVVGTCGHSTNGKAAGAYQSFAQGLARQGYACLLYDPIGQGERLQYLNEELGSSIGVGVREHLHAGNQQFLVGEFLGAWRAWDGVRALDYLLSRPEIDRRHLGVTGNSGGGTMTTWLCGVEPRWTMAAPSCFVTTFRRNLENELPADTEQCPPRALALGLDHDDFLVAMAPKPVIILAKERDYFDARGSEETYGRLRKVYQLLGAEDNVKLFIGPTTHGYSQENREAMYAWFNRQTNASKTSDEPEITLEGDEDLWCTPRGQVGAEANTKTVMSYTRSLSQKLSQERGRVGPAQLRSSLPRVLRLPAKPAAPPDYRIWRYLGSRGYPSPHAIAYAVETERRMRTIVYRLTKERWHSRPPRGGSEALLYVSHLSSDAELRSEPLVQELVRENKDTPFFACDVRGIGESQPDTCAPNSFHSPYGSDYFYAIHSIMLDRPYVGQRTFDILRVLDFLGNLGHDNVHLIAKGWGAIPATFAAVLSERVKRVTLKNALISYTSLAEASEYEWPLSAFSPGALKSFDLPDCYRALSAKGLRSIEPWDSRAQASNQPTK